MATSKGPLERAQWGPFEQGDLAERAAFLVRGICEAHPFEDGNKRTAYACGFAFLRVNDATLAASDSAIIELMFAVAQGEREIEAIAAWMRGHLENV